MNSSIKQKSVYISNQEYMDIRNDLCSKNGSTIKMALQSLITRFETGRTLNKRCSNDLCALLYDIVKNPEPGIRKWAYHLVVYCNNFSLVDHCIKNLQTGFETDKENITWIFSLASMHSREDYVWEMYRKYGSGQISYEAYTICSNLFTRGNTTVNLNTVRKIVDSSDFLSKMWLTKIYACRYRRDKQQSLLQTVNHDVMNELLQDGETQRYALWAFSAKRVTDISKISILPSNSHLLPPASQSWYYTILFKDSQYVARHQDHVMQILDDFFYLPQIVKLGILRGLEATPYELDYLISPLITIHCNLEEKNAEHIPLLVSLTQILSQHAGESEEIQELLADQLQNTKLDQIKRMVALIPIRQKGEQAMIVNINSSGNNIQNIEKANTVNQFGTRYVMEDASSLISIGTEIQKIFARLQSGEFDDRLDKESDIVANFATNMQFSCQNARGMLTEPTAHEVVTILQKIDNSNAELSKATKQERKTKIADIISCVSGLCTIVDCAPGIWGFLQDAFTFIKTLLGLS